jgi:hypothetical protein
MARKKPRSAALDWYDEELSRGISVSRRLKLSKQQYLH